MWAKVPTRSLIMMPIFHRLIDAAFIIECFFYTICYFDAYLLLLLLLVIRNRSIDFNSNHVDLRLEDKRSLNQKTNDLSAGDVGDISIVTNCFIHLFLWPFVISLLAIQ
ncbi:hypothetical protein BLOT_011271 [Blomia tropicalis]|nr:hypothetical protein BLOT_011271 [Blomia tropicalis]